MARCSQLRPAIQPGGVLLTSMGASLRRHEVQRVATDAGQRWIVTIEVEKQEFTKR